MQKNHAFLIVVLFALSSMGLCAFAQDSKTANTPPTFHMTGSAELLSKWVEHGLAQTDKSPALQGSFWFNFGPQARIGLWGSNTDYPGEDAHLVLKPTADVKIIFSPNTDFVVSYAQNMYYNSSDRNGNTVGLHLTSFGYRVNYEIMSNWEGTKTSANYFSFGKTFNVFGNWKWDNEAGYSMLKAVGYDNYFDIRSFLGYQLGQVFLQGGATGTSTTKQFHGAGGYYLIVSASTEF